ncbi:Oidioi.mRNA.OKI2018_I69.PAR.g9862.t1.cds [Oikopleura dioica]|uniref:Oidioi.mRNA.OKI2018_I69.PAR.g9862.t1.cds n=1 Tax=Oikopleura dioica TaxID=34765 RepID=A0ABN7RTI3_OIKDI|nr:Oidioi.mRNA.OKI2018_I69.PAR.g9862.t1.cds [Oikopleura dioica]
MRFFTLELLLVSCLAKSYNRYHYDYYWYSDSSDSYWPMTIGYYEYQLESILSEVEAFYTDNDFKNICKKAPANDSLVESLNVVRQYIEDLDKPVTQLFTNSDFQAFTIVDFMMIIEGILTNFKKSWCNKVISAVKPALENGSDEQETVSEITKAVTQVFLEIFNTDIDLGSEFTRFFAMVEEMRGFLLQRVDLFGEASEIMEAILKSIDFSSNDSENLSDILGNILGAFDSERTCSEMDEVMPIIDTVKPLAQGLISDFQEAFWEKQGLLSIGKMIYFEYRFAKHFLFNDNACSKLMQDGSGIVEYFTRELEKLSGRRRREQDGLAMIGEMMGLLGDFVESEIAPFGQQPLTYDLFKMSLIGETLLQALPNMVKTIKSEIDPVLEIMEVVEERISQAQWENYFYDDYGNGVSEIGSFFDDIEFQNICKRKPEDDDLVGALNVVREYIEDLDEQITEFLTDKDFQAFTVVDGMKITERLLSNMNKNWCNKVVSAIIPAMESQGDELKAATDFTESIVGIILNIFRKLGVNPQVDRLVAMLEEVKAFMLAQSDLWGEAKDTVRTIIQAIKFTASADPSNLGEYDEQCLIMDEVMPIFNKVKPLALGLIREFNNAVSGKEGLLSIGKMIYFEYRLSKHFLLNENACTKLTEDGAQLFEDLMGEMNGVEDLLSQVNVDQLLEGDLSQLMNMATRRRRQAESSTMMSDVMSILGDFMKSETPPAGQQPLSYDMYKMSEVGQAVLKSVPNMVKTIKSNMDELLIMAGMDEHAINAVKKGIKEEDFRALADEMSADLSSATEKMVCGDVKNCEDLVSFKSQAQTENKEASKLPGVSGGAGKEIISFTTVFLLLFAFA